MTRTEFLASLISGATAVKVVAEIIPGSKPTKRLLAIEFPQHLSPALIAKIHEDLTRYTEGYGVEFLILEGGARIVDPHGPTQAGPTFAEVRSIADEEAIKHRELLLKDICHLFAVPPDQIV